MGASCTLLAATTQHGKEEIDLIVAENPYSCPIRLMQDIARNVPMQLLPPKASMVLKPSWVLFCALIMDSVLYVLHRSRQLWLHNVGTDSVTPRKEIPHGRFPTPIKCARETKHSTPCLFMHSIDDHITPFKHTTVSSSFFDLPFF